MSRVFGNNHFCYQTYSTSAVKLKYETPGPADCQDGNGLQLEKSVPLYIFSSLL